MRAAALYFSAQHLDCPFLKLHLPLRDLIGMNVEVLRKFSQRVLAPDGS